MCAKRDEILKLYRSITSGVSQCHNTGNEKGCSGTVLPSSVPAPTGLSLSFFQLNQPATYPE